ncbi:MAG TPA: hypothetical protein VHY75_11490 [Steroidobacteraceae bacterium]|nr:hypothetical protein [Steroidobacteraceae bacterium]
MTIQDDIDAARLPHLGILRFQGPDAIAFLQGQVSNDTAPLGEGSPVLAAYSSAQGRVLAIMHLLPHSTGVLAVLPRELAAATQERLRKFVLRAKVKIEDLSGQWSVAGLEARALVAAGIDTSESTGDLERTGYLEQDGIGIGRVRPRLLSPAPGPEERYWLVGPAESSAAVDIARAGPDGGARTDAERSDVERSDVERSWRLADIRDGLPQVYAATSESFVAQMLNLDLIGGISFSKGCYTGQEIIARTQHRGRIKRRMSRLRLARGSWAIGQALKLADGRSGRLTEIAPAGEGFEALAVLSLDATVAADADSGPGVGETVSAEELALPYPRGEPAA